MEKNQSQKNEPVKNIIFKYFSEFIRWFVAITTGVLMICAVDFALFNKGDIPKTTLRDILLSGLATTAVTVIFWKIKDVKKGESELAAMLLHYLCLCVVMVIFGTKFGWMELNFSGILMMALSVAAVYIFSFVVNYLLDVQQANVINQKLKEKYDK